MQSSHLSKIITICRMPSLHLVAYGLILDIFESPITRLNGRTSHLIIKIYPHMDNNTRMSSLAIEFFLSLFSITLLSKRIYQPVKSKSYTYHDKHPFQYKMEDYANHNKIVDYKNCLLFFQVSMLQKNKIIRIRVPGLFYTGGWISLTLKFLISTSFAPSHLKVAMGPPQDII
uniref:Uncharacterized protein n=1 Tax=uncultured crenarchaeote TaxID=29281 RepID=Q8NKM2_9CREN|nr:hypothetical protein [uncultured crenarchaeote]